MHSSFIIAKAAESDVEAMATCYFDAFLDAQHPQTPFYAQMFPRTPSTHAFFATSLAEQMRREPHSMFLKAIDVNDEGKLVGFIKWVPPASDDSFWSDYGPDQDATLCDAFFGAMARSRGSLMGDRPHWLVELIGVDAKYARKGAGGLLIDQGCKMADRDCVEAYVDASPLARPLYERFGFEAKATEAMPEPFGFYIESFMVRPKRERSPRSREF